MVKNEIMHSYEHNYAILFQIMHQFHIQLLIAGDEFVFWEAIPKNVLLCFQNIEINKILNLST